MDWPWIVLGVVALACSVVGAVLSYQSQKENGDNYLSEKWWDKKDKIALILYIIAVILFVAAILAGVYLK